MIRMVIGGTLGVVLVGWQFIGSLIQWVFAIVMEDEDEVVTDKGGMPW